MLHQKMKALERSQHFPKRSRAANSPVQGPIWLIFFIPFTTIWLSLLPARVLVTCKNEEDLINLYQGTLETHHYTFTVFFTNLIQRFLSPYKMVHYLSYFRFANAVHSDVTPTLMFFNNCCLTNVILIQFGIKHVELVARCLNEWKNTNGFGNNHLISLQGAAFLCLRQHISNCNNMQMMFAHAGILLTFKQWIDEYLVELKDFDYSCS